PLMFILFIVLSLSVLYLTDLMVTVVLLLPRDLKVLKVIRVLLALLDLKVTRVLQVPRVPLGHIFDPARPYTRAEAGFGVKQ
ncbi:hypothetical protein, partial [Bacillus cereus]|uniref:hypothetical protein n=1 Tax=Bacillus cereus TaxID=1396 RepID=UPI001A7EB316